MNPRLITGIFDTFDHDRFERESRPDFAGAELLSLASWDEAVTTVTYLRRRSLSFGVHFPLVKGRYDGVGLHPSLLDPEAKRREHDFDIVGQALREAESLGAEYLLIHFPKPALLAADLDWSDWRFPQPGEALLDTEVDLAAFTRSARQVFGQLAQLAADHATRLVLELDILHPLFYQSLVHELYASQSVTPGLGLCLDTGRLHLQEATDPAFSGVELIRALRPWLTNIHLWTVRVGQNRSGGHHPLLPGLTRADGWGPMAEYLDEFAAGSDAMALFEHRTDLITSRQLDECYDWVRQRLQGRR